MKIMFIYPGFENIGIEYLSSVVREKGHETELAFDPQLFNDPFLKLNPLANFFSYQKEILRQIYEFGPSLIAFSVVSANYKWALNLAKKIKEFSSAHITFGGIHPTSVPEKVIQKNYVDSVVVGEGEFAFLELADSISSGKLNTDIPNVWFKKGEEIIDNPVRPYIESLDSLPFPDKELYYKQIPSYRRGYTLVTRRGCVNSCSYCHNSVLNRIYPGEPKIRFRSVDNVLGELNIAKEKYDFKLLRVNDDLFTFNKRWLREFSKRYKKEINVPLYCFGSPSTIDEEVIAYLKDAGCYQLCLGVQSIKPGVRKDVFNREGDNNQIVKAIELCRQYNIRVVVDNIIGYPGEEESDLLRMAEFYNQHRPHRICIFWLVYYPKISIIDMAKKMGILDEKDIEKLEREPYDTANTLYNVAHAKKKKKYHLFLVLYHILPRKIFTWMLRYKLFRFLPNINPTLLEYPYTMFAKDRLDIPRRRYYLRYLRYIPKIIWYKMKGWLYE